MASIKRALVALFATLIVSSAFAAETPFPWKNPGGDPCNPKAGCTLEWALGKTGWPTEVKNVLTNSVQTERAANFEVKPGWKGWMTWGKYQAKYQPNTVAAWEDGHGEHALLWQSEYKGKMFNLLRVTKCGNWGGWVEAIPPKPAPGAPPKVAAVEVPKKGTPIMPLGVLPIVACPE